MKYNFDEVINRRGTYAMTTDGYKSYIFHDPNITFPFPEEEFIRMWVADMDFAVAPEILDGIRHRLDQRILGYTELSDPTYFDIFCRWCQKRYGWEVDSRQVVTSPGIVSALKDLVRLLLNPGDKVLIFTPSYGPFQEAAKDNGLEIICSDLCVNKDGYYTMNMDDFREKAARPDVRLCIFCNPHNPSGRLWTEKELKQVAEIIEKNSLWVISDEIHCDILRTGLAHVPLAKIMAGYDRIITCMSVSKTFNLAGLMFSNIIIVNQKLRYRWKKTHEGLDNPLSVAAAQAAYERGENWLTQMRTYLDENFRVTDQFIKDKLPKAVFRIPEATYLAWIDVSAYVDKEDFLPLLFATKGKILIESGNMFVRNAEGKIRLNLACPKSVLEEGLRRVVQVLIG